MDTGVHRRVGLRKIYREMKINGASLTAQTEKIKFLNQSHSFRECSSKFTDGRGVLAGVAFLILYELEVSGPWDFDSDLNWA